MCVLDDDERLRLFLKQNKKQPQQRQQNNIVLYLHLYTQQ